jgi:WhiB family redox-sensing transcriptional regulator
MTEWIDQAACRRFDAELFFPVGSGPAAARQAARAKAVCACCPVSEQCLTWALCNGEVDGIWGGLDVDERRALSTVVSLPRQHRPDGANRPDKIAPAGAVRRFGRAASVEC